MLRILWKNVSKNLETIFAEVQSKLFKNFCSGSKNPKWKATYVNVNEQIEKWSKVIHFIMVKLTPIALILAKAVVNVLIYFTDSQTIELELPFPMWCVQIFIKILLNSIVSLQVKIIKKLLYNFEVSIGHKQFCCLCGCCCITIYIRCVELLLRC